MHVSDVIVKINDLTLKNGNEILVKKLNWQIKRGEYWALIGENGSGKTTLAKIIAGISDNKEGDKHIHRYGKIIYLPQYLSREYVPFTVEEMIKYYNIEKKYIDVFHLNNFKHKTIEELSGGMSQALFISLFLSIDADLYILDEPNNMLDFNKESKLYILLKEKVEDGKSVILITHEIDWVNKNVEHVACIHKKEKTLLFHCPFSYYNKYGVKIRHDIDTHNH